MKKLILLHVIALVLTGCDQVVDLKLNNVAAQLTIEGSVNNGPGPYQVIINQSVDFYHDNTYPPISGALVVINDSTANVTDTLSEVVPGTYQTHVISGTPGHAYKLTIAIGGKTYTSTSVMPQPVILDSVSFDYDTKNKIRAIANFQDPAGMPSYYRFTSYVNGKYLKEVHTFEDRLSDGRYIREQMDNDTSDIKKGNLVLLNLMCTDKQVHTFFKESEDITYDNSNLAAPTTPQSNISGGALGYFSAETISSKSGTPRRTASTN